MPEKHHYLPIFYQARWATGGDRQVCVYKKPQNEVKTKRRHPAFQGYEVDLYTIPGVEYEAASHLEHQFFLQADDDAAVALQQFERDQKTALDNRLRSGWSRFVISLIHRGPEEIQRFFDEVKRHVQDAEREFEENYATLRLPTEPTTFEEFRLKRPTNLAGRAAAMLIQKVIDNVNVGNHLNNMIWTILSPPSSYPFLTSDRPVIMTNGMIKPESHLALPIGPRKLFIASNRNEIVQEVARRKPDELVSFVNDRVVKQARRFVIGVDDQQLRFVANRFGARLPSSPTELTKFPSPEEMRKLVRYSACTLGFAVASRSAVITRSASWSSHFACVRPWSPSRLCDTICSQWTQVSLGTGPIGGPSRRRSQYSVTLATAACHPGVSITRRFIRPASRHAALIRS
ncbi:MAG: DUF4238 domain-containing protein [Beijerinckiaceae bacterium]|nr:MAG: DUF4238 domain-containing protein [Beijerinckiaceae bacterium]